MIDEAIRQMRSFILRYPRSRYVPEAQQLIEDGERRRRANDEYVVGFYARKGKWRGVAWRLELLLTRHPVAPHTPANYALLAKAYEELGWHKRAHDVWRAYTQRFPTDPDLARAKAGQARAAARMDAISKAGGDPDAPPADAPKPPRLPPERAADEALDET
jgi:outer membrane protein assembly factor BamD